MNQTLILCRPLYERDLLDELKHRYQYTGPSQTGHGFALVQAQPERPLVFERQRMPRVGFAPMDSLKGDRSSLVQTIFDRLIAEPMPWAPLLFTQEEAKSKLPVQLEGMFRDLEKLVYKKAPALKALQRKPENLLAQNRGQILQLFLCEAGLYYSTARPEELTAQTAGGVLRMRFDSGAPSRSYLKVEEALALLKVEPEAGSLVVDLGAAPGGWTYAFAKRNCHVTSVDNGPMKIKGEYGGTVTHLRRDGLTFNPESKYLPVQWLIADMLIAPPKALTLLKKWIGQSWCENLIVNIKLPQQNPYMGLGAILDWVDSLPGHQLQIRQLYHDRQEVTVFGRVRKK